MEFIWGGRTVRAIAPADFDGTPVEQAGLTINPNRVHLFGSKTGKRIE